MSFVDPAQSFADHFDEFVDGQRRVDLARALEAARSDARREQVRDLVITGSLTAEVVEGVADDPIGRLALLLGIDSAFAFVNPASTDVAAAPGLVAQWDHYQRHGYFDLGDRDGLLLPMLASRAEPQLAPLDHFDSLVRVSAESARRVRVVRVHPLRPIEDPVRVGCVAMGPSTATFERLQRFDEAWYRPLVSFDPPEDFQGTAEEWLDERIRLAVDALATEGVRVGVAPEYTVLPGDIERWSTELRRRGSRSLALVITGTGTHDVVGYDAPANRCVVLDGLSGQVIAEQDKLHSYSMTQRDLTEVEIAGAEEPFDILHEWMVEGTELVLIEAAPMRLAVLICEDLGRVDVHGRLLHRVGATHVVSPVLSHPLKAGRDLEQQRAPYGWEATAAQNLARRAGVHVVVSNSHALIEDPMNPRAITSFDYSPALRGPNGQYRRPRVARLGADRGRWVATVHELSRAPEEQA